MPRYATEREQSRLRIVVGRSGECISHGYIRIVSWEASKGRVSFVECTAEQIQKKIFTLDRANPDPYGNFNAYITPSGFRAREYRRDIGEHMRAGCWYLALSFVDVEVIRGAI
jgi:hypothetical protein